MKMSELGGRGRGRRRNKPAESRFVTVGNSAALVVSDMSSVSKLTENDFAPCWRRSLRRPLALTNWILVRGASWRVGFSVGVVFFWVVSIIFVSTQSIHGLWRFSQS